MPSTLGISYDIESCERFKERQEIWLPIRNQSGPFNPENREKLGTRAEKNRENIWKSTKVFKKD